MLVCSLITWINNKINKQQQLGGAININYNQMIMSRQSWNREQDEVIIRSVAQLGLNDWPKIAYRLKEQLSTANRTGKQCRERWYNHLSPNVNKKPWSQQQEDQLFIYHKKCGNKWKQISGLLKGRTDNDVKNHFYSTMRRSLRRLNKIVGGQKNSTTQMRQIKPCVLSNIMNFIYEKQFDNSQFVESLKSLPSLIFQFAKFKPCKNQLNSSNFDSIKQKTNEIFTLVQIFNAQYEKSKIIKQQYKVDKVINRSEPLLKKEHSMSKMEESYSGSQDQASQIDQQQQVQVKIEQSYFERSDNPIMTYNHHEQLPFGHQEYQYHSSQHSLKISQQNSSSKIAFNSKFSLQADQIMRLEFQQPQEPSRLYIGDHETLLNNKIVQSFMNKNQESQLLNLVIQTGFGQQCE